MKQLWQGFPHRHILSWRSLLTVFSVLLVLLGGVTAAILHHPSPTHASPAITYDGPLTITQGGTYSGNWESTDPTIPAVFIQTTDPVVIENCNVRGPGTLISASNIHLSQTVVNTDVTIRNCSGIGITPNVSGWSQGYFYFAVYYKRADLENNDIEGTTGIQLIGQNQAGTQQAVTVLRNRARNIDGRTSDGTTCAMPIGYCGRSFLQLNGALSVPNIEIAWNEVINAPDQSRTEDNINIYNSSGTPDSPILIHDNYIQGAYPAHPESDSYTGSGIDLADGDSSVDANHATAYVHAYQNQVVSTANAGIFIAAGHDNTFYDNHVVSSGYLPDGRTIKNHFSGIYVWDCCYGQKAKGVFYNNTAHDNVIGYAYIDTNGNAVRNDTYLPDCATDSNGASLCTNNTSLPDPITLDTERNEYLLWQQKVSQNHVMVGLPNFSTSFESGNLLLDWINTVDSDPYPAGNVNNIGGVCCGLTEPETKVLYEAGHSGSGSLMYSGNDTSSEVSYAYTKVFDLSNNNIVIGPTTTLSYWVYPQSSQTFGGLAGNNSTCVAIDLIFQDSSSNLSNLRDSGAVDQNGNRAHPAAQCGHLNLDQWNLVTINLGNNNNGKTIIRLDVGYDQPANTGPYRGYIDDISIQ